jgi:hypothetical protein
MNEMKKKSAQYISVKTKVKERKQANEHIVSCQQYNLTSFTNGKNLWASRTSKGKTGTKKNQKANPNGHKNESQTRKQNQPVQNHISMHTWSRQR